MRRLRVWQMIATCAAATLLVARPAAQNAGLPEHTIVPIQVVGDPATHFSLVVLGDGYTAADMPKFRQHLDKHLNTLWSIEPFRSYRNYFNVYAIEVVSPVSGINCDPEIRQEKVSALHASFGEGCTNINARGVTLDQAGQALVRELAARATPNFDQLLVIANSDTYGGIGGRYATTTGGNALSPLITPHELGHSLGGLTDEYTYSARGRAGGTYDAARGEPASIHTTLLTEDAMRAEQKKWFRWLGEPSEAGGLIGRFEGGSGNTKGIWRPSQHSMMISLGYYYDQVSRERMVQRIAERAGLITGSTPTDTPLFSGQQIWVDVAHPVYHDLMIAWRVGDRVIADAANQPYLNLTREVLTTNDRTVTVTVADMTDFVRDPAIRSGALTATRSWSVRYAADVAIDRSLVAPAITNATQTTRAVGGRDVVFIDHSHVSGTPKVDWTLDGRVDAANANRFTFNLAQRSLPTGTHTLTVTLPSVPGSSTSDTRRTWTIDNTPPDVAYRLSTPVASVKSADGVEHAFMRDEFTMKLEPMDDQPGYLVAEFRVDGDGWHHYYGYPDAPPGTPFKFTPRGTKIKELIYGSLSAEGVSPQPWEPREPGWGTRTIEYRAIDAAGNYSPAKAFHVTVMPSPQCTATVTGAAASVTASTGVTCLDGATVSGPVTVAADATLVATNSTIIGALTATKAATIELVNSSVEGALALDGTTERVTIFGATVGGAASINNSTSAKAPLITGSTLQGGLACSGNAVAPTNGSTHNTVTRGATGQCGGL